MRLRIVDGLALITVSIAHQGRSVSLDNVLLDTGSVSTIFLTDHMIELGLEPQPNDQIDEIFGVGGSEHVYRKTVDRLAVGDLAVENFRIELGAMDYGIDLDGIIGLDFLLHVRAQIDLGSLEVR